MAKAEFLMLAHDYDPEKSWVAGWFMSEKMDGTRAFWDGGISRGMFAKDVPYANIEKDARYKFQPVATGLWSRYGNVIHAPDWFLEQLPKGICLDGELWMGRGTFQQCRSIVSTLIPSDDWAGVKYHCFDSPSYVQTFSPRKIDNNNFKKQFKAETLDWSVVHGDKFGRIRAGTPFESTVKFLERILKDNSVAVAHPQEQLPFMESKAKEVIDGELSFVTLHGGEGLILRAPNSLWVPERAKTLLKVKKLKDAEAVVIGYTTGRETDKGSKLLGLMGALVTKFNGKRLELSGFTDAERLLAPLDGSLGIRESELWAKAHPGEECPYWIHNPNFPRGSRVTFQYRELSDDGIPKEARYYRRALD